MPFDITTLAAYPRYAAALTALQNAATAEQTARTNADAAKSAFDTASTAVQTATTAHVAARVELDASVAAVRAEENAALSPIARNPGAGAVRDA